MSLSSPSIGGRYTCTNDIWARKTTGKFTIEAAQIQISNDKESPYLKRSRNTSVDVDDSEWLNKNKRQFTFLFFDRYQ